MIEGNGLTGLLHTNEDNKITICGEVCELDIGSSSGTQVDC